MSSNLTPHPWWAPVIWSAYLAGIAAGSYALAALANLWGGESSRRATRGAYYLTLPLIVASVVLWYADIGPRGRRASLSWGPLALGVFGLLSLGLLLCEDGRLGTWFSKLITGFRGSLTERLFAAAGILVALYAAASTGIGRPHTWANTTALSAVFLASAAASGAASVILLACWRVPDLADEAVELLARVVGWAIVVELAMLTYFTLTLRGLSGLAFQRWPGMLIPLFVVPVCLVVPLLLPRARGRPGVVDSALLVLLGGYVLRAAVVGIPESLMFR